MENYKSEAHLQSLCREDFERNYRLQIGKLRLIYNNPPNARVGALLKSMGLKKGTSDMVYFAPGGIICWIEFKLTGEYQTSEQKDFQSLVESYGGMYKIIRSIDQFKELIKSLNNG